jgi:hypothetical protein
MPKEDHPHTLVNVRTDQSHRHLQVSRYPVATTQIRLTISLGCARYQPCRRCGTFMCIRSLQGWYRRAQYPVYAGVMLRIVDGEHIVDELVTRSDAMMSLDLGMCLIPDDRSVLVCGRAVEATRTWNTFISSVLDSILHTGQLYVTGRTAHIGL